MTEDPRTTSERVAAVVADLAANGDAEARTAMADQYGIHAAHAYGVPMKRLKAMAKPLAPDHDLALGLWPTGSYDARVLAVFVDDPAQVTNEQMADWAADFDNWAIVDAACFHLFDRTPSAWSMVEPWAVDDREFVRRAGFALLWALALHDKVAADDAFADRLHLIEDASRDDRHLVTKSLTMAMRAIATKRPGLAEEVLALARRLVESDDPNARRAGGPIVKAFG